MAISVSLKDRIKMGNAFMVVADITLDDSYPKDGEVIDPGSMGLNVIDGLMAYPASGYVFEFDHSASKLKGYAAATTEITDKTNLSAIVVRVIAVGI